MIDPRAWSALVREGSIGPGRGYFENWWDSDDPTTVVRIIIRNIEPLDEIRNRVADKTGVISDSIRKVLPRAGRRRNKEDIASHYDLGNDFFQIFLDETLTYSSAIFSSGEAALVEGSIQRIILTRPAVEAGESLGFLPGDLQAKVDPYLRPLFDALYDMLDPDRVNGFFDRGVIEVAPLAFMRGRTLNDAFIILDEAQNTTPEQMKMFLTRLGYNSKMVVTGDVTQIDLPNERRSGLVTVGEILDGVEDVRFIRFGGEDVVRHHLVQRIVAAYASRPPAGKSG